MEQVKDVDTRQGEARNGTAGSSLRSKLSLRDRLSKPARPVKLVTRLARTTQEDSKTTFDMKLKVKIAQSDFPLGIERLINTADLSAEDESSDE